jgi:hypothetical protein
MIEFLAAIAVLAKAASAAAAIFKAGLFVNNYIKNVKDPQQLMEECSQLIGSVDNKLDVVSLGASKLIGRVEGLVGATATGFERIQEAFSQASLRLTVVV